MKRTLILGLGLLLALQGCQSGYKVKGDTVTVKLENVQPGAPSQVRLQVMGPKLVRVSATPDGTFHDRKSLVVLPVKEKTRFSVEMEEGVVKVSTGEVVARVDPKDGKLSFTDASGKLLLASGTGGQMSFAPIEVEGKKA